MKAKYFNWSEIATKMWHNGIYEALIVDENTGQLHEITINDNASYNITHL